MWDGELCGTINFRRRPGTSTLPDYVLGHIGYAVVPWKRGQGYARAALLALLPEIRERGLTYVELTTDPDNKSSQRVILDCGSQLVGRFCKPAMYGGRKGCVIA